MTDLKKALRKAEDELEFWVLVSNEAENVRLDVEAPGSPAGYGEMHFAIDCAKHAVAQQQEWTRTVWLLKRAVERDKA